jgi:hypothetical protein
MDGEVSDMPHSKERRTDVDAYHKLETCNDVKREVAVEIAKLQEIKFETGVCCQLCAVPQETCHDSRYFSRQGVEKCFV